MKILMIVPKYRLINHKDYGYFFPSGLAYISAVIKKAGYELDCLNLNHFEGKIKDIKIPCDGLSCSISPDGRNFGITTMGPEWGVYYFDNKGKLIWKKKFDKRIGGIELSKDQIVLYDKMHKETRNEVMKLDNNGGKE